MGKVSKVDKKIAYNQKLCQLLDDYTQVLISVADNVGSNQLQNVRHALRGDSVILMGKNTMMKRLIRMHSEKTGNKAYLNLIPLLVYATTKKPRASLNGDGSSSGGSKGNPFVVPGATVATIFMLGALHARRMYSDKKIKEARESGTELELQPDVKAKFLNILPLRSISRFWGYLSGMELPIWLRPNAYRAWARAFHSNLEEASLPLDEYVSLKDFVIRALKAGSRPIDSDPHSLVYVLELWMSPVDGTVGRVGELKEGVMIEQVKGFSYSVSSLLGVGSSLPLMPAADAHTHEDSSWQ